MALEKLVASKACANQIGVVVGAWFTLCMIYASMRFDDAIHINPNKIEVSDESIRMVAWQTKVDRNRKGTKFIVPNVSMSGTDWLFAGHQVWKREFDKANDQSIDFWLCSITGLKTIDVNVVFGYDAFVSHLRAICSEAISLAVEIGYITTEEFDRLEITIPWLTAHSA